MCELLLQWSLTPPSSVKRTYCRLPDPLYTCGEWNRPGTDRLHIPYQGTYSRLG